MAAKSLVAVITGGAGGMGRACAELLGSRGWSVVVGDKDADKLKWTDDADYALGVVADISTEQGNVALIEAAEKKFGGVDAVLLNAAMPMGGAIEETPMEAFERVLQVNLIGSVLGIRAALPALRRRGGGSIVVTASTHGVAGDAGSWAYAASKHGLVGVMRCAARDVGHENIRVNAICPGPTRATGFSTDLESDMPDFYSMVANAVPLKRWGEPHEIGAVMAFLLSPEASFINGATIVVDGGALAGTGLLPPAGA